MAAALSMIGPKRIERALQVSDRLIDLFAFSGLEDARDERFDCSKIALDPGLEALVLAGPGDEDARPAAMLAALKARGATSTFLAFLEQLGRPLHRDAILAAIATTIAWGPLMRKRISRLTARTLPWYLRLYGVMIGASIPGRHHQRDSLYGIPRAERFGHWTVAELIYLALTGKRPDTSQADQLQLLIGLLISNGPGAISAQGAKGAVSADGPQTPERVQINKGMIGFLTHTGFAHGGNGFEGIALLLEQFRGTGLRDPADPDHGLDLEAMALAFARAYRAEKKQQKELGASEARALPGVHHPVFRGQAVNHDPREVFIGEVMAKQGQYNVFHQFYKQLVVALHEVGASPYVFCVNVDAVIAALLLALLWRDYQDGTLTERDLETAAFTVFLFGRMIGAAAEIDDHLNRGRNMDTRTPASACRFVT
jgi:hypothetical protein